MPLFLSNRNPKGKVPSLPSYMQSQSSIRRINSGLPPVPYWPKNRRSKAPLSEKWERK